MAEVIAYADAEKTLTGFLTAKNTTGVFGGVKAGTKVPNPRPDEFIRVLLVGGFASTLVTSTPRLVVEAWAVNKGRAVALAEKCRQDITAAALDGGMGAVTLHRVNVVSLPQNLPDPETTQYRYTATYELQLRA